MEESPKRRKTDLDAMQQDRIAALIEDSDNPKDRAFLIVLQQINSSLIANTATTDAIAAKLDEHISAYRRHADEEAELLATGRGMWRIGAWVLGLIQAATLACLLAGYQAVDELHRHVAADQVTDLEMVRAAVRQQLQEHHK